MESSSGHFSSSIKEISTDIFDKCTKPILTYASDTWGYEVLNAIENVYLYFCRKQLGVGVCTPSPAVMGKCGRFDIYLDCFEKLIKYWIKLLGLKNCLLKSCYDMLCIQCNSGRFNWASHVNKLLYVYDFGYTGKSRL